MGELLCLGESKLIVTWGKSLAARTGGKRIRGSFYMYVYMYIYVYICTDVYIYVYMYIYKTLVGTNSSMCLHNLQSTFN